MGYGSADHEGSLGGNPNGSERECQRPTGTAGPPLLQPTARMLRYLNGGSEVWTEQP
jgi:hypothetical protein